jgi:chromosome segregation ATPase
MSESIVQARDASIIAAEIETIKTQTKRMILSASVEIGRKLLEAKELVPHGSWTQWLKEKVNYSQSTANNLMRIAKEYGDEQVDLFSGESKCQTFANLSYSQAVALFALPADEREEFVQKNKVEDMSAREIQEAIKAKEQAEREKAAALEAADKVKNQLDGTKQLLEIANQNKDKLEQALKKSDSEKAAVESEIRKLKKELAAVRDAEPAPPSEGELRKMREQVRKQIEVEYQKKSEQLTLEKKTAEEKAMEIEKSYQEKLKQLKLDNESILARQKEAEKKLALSSPQTEKFSVYFETFQQNFNSMTAVLRNMENTELSDKLRTALGKIIKHMAIQLG